MAPAIPDDAPDTLDPLPPHDCKGTLCAAHTGSGGIWPGPPYKHRIALINTMTMKDTEDRQYYREDPKKNVRRRLRTREDYKRLNRALAEWAAVPV